jgi:uncharacterized protein (DUF3084 family)
MLYYTIGITILCITAIIGWHTNYQLRLEYANKVDGYDYMKEDLETISIRYRSANNDKDRLKAQIATLTTERNEARQVAEKFREKYLRLKHGDAYVEELIEKKQAAQEREAILQMRKNTLNFWGAV